MTVSTAMRLPFHSSFNHHRNLLFPTIDCHQFSKDKMVKSPHQAQSSDFMIVPRGLHIDDESSTMSVQETGDEKNQVRHSVVSDILRRRRMDTNDQDLEDLWVIQRANPVFDSRDEDIDE
jgi:hypothetical protein